MPMPELDVPKMMVQSEAHSLAAGSVPQGQQPPPQLIGGGYADGPQAGRRRPADG